MSIQRNWPVSGKRKRKRSHRDLSPPATGTDPSCSCPAYSGRVGLNRRGRLRPVYYNRKFPFQSAAGSKAVGVRRVSSLARKTSSQPGTESRQGEQEEEEEKEGEVATF